MDVRGAGGGTSVLGVRGLDSASLLDTWRGALGPAESPYLGRGHRPRRQRQASLHLVPSRRVGEGGQLAAFGALVT